MLTSLALGSLTALHAVEEPRVAEVGCKVSTVLLSNVLAQLPTQVGATRRELLTNDDIRVLKELAVANPTKLVERLPDGNLRVISELRSCR